MPEKRKMTKQQKKKRWRCMKRVKRYNDRCVKQKKYPIAESLNALWNNDTSQSSDDETLQAESVEGHIPDRNDGGGTNRTVIDNTNVKSQQRSTVHESIAVQIDDALTDDDELQSTDGTVQTMRFETGKLNNNRKANNAELMQYDSDDDGDGQSNTAKFQSTAHYRDIGDEDSDGSRVDNDDDVENDNDHIGQGGGDDDGDGNSDNDEESSTDDDSDSSWDDDGDENAFAIEEDDVIMSGQNLKKTIFTYTVAEGIGERASLKKIVRSMKNINDCMNDHKLPETKRSLWKTLNRKRKGITKKYLYCKVCKDVLGCKEKPARDCQCGKSGPGKEKKNMSYFIILNLRAQLKRLLTNPAMKNHLKYRVQRKKINPEGIEDIYDGKEYIAMLQNDKFLDHEWNFTFTLNTDGCSVGKSTRSSAWPVLLTINELPPHLRKKYMILCGIWVDKGHPNLNAFMEPIGQQLQSLYKDGVEWNLHDNRNRTVVSRFKTIVCSVDAVARYEIMNMSRFNAEHGCTFCYAKATTTATKKRIYKNAPIRLRTDDEIRRHMTQATQSKKRVKGIVGNSILRMLPGFHLRNGISVDYMHNVCLGVTKKFTKLILDNTSGSWYRGDPTSLRIINSRLMRIQPPGIVSRLPRQIQEREVWKASEWRNWLLYYSVPCLKDVIRDSEFQLLSLLSEAIHILCRNDIMTDELARARLLLQQYRLNFEKIFGNDHMNFNLHLTAHLVDCVENLGPLWATSTFSFEAYNKRIIESIKSPHERQTQIMTHYLLLDFMRKFIDTDTADEEVNMKVKEKLINGKKKSKMLPLQCGELMELYGVERAYEKVPLRLEQQLIEDLELSCRHTMTVYPRALIKGVEYRSKSRETVTRQHCDKFVYTKNGRFAEILEMVTFQDAQGNRINGSFVYYFTDDNNRYLPFHIRQVRLARNKAFVEAKNIICPAILITTNNDITYGVRLANTWETD